MNDDIRRKVFEKQFFESFRNAFLGGAFLKIVFG
jgi:hypothetical protein